MKSTDDDAETVIDTDDMTLEFLTLDQNKKAKFTMNNITTWLRNLFIFDKKAKIDYTYLAMLEIIKNWNTCTENEFKGKHYDAQKILDELHIKGSVVGISVNKFSFCEKYMTPMMYPLFVAILFYDETRREHRTACIFKDIHQIPYVHFHVPLFLSTVSPGTLTVCEETTSFNKRMLCNADEAMKKRRKCC